MKMLLPFIFLVSSCSLLDTSFYDDNESMLAVEVRFEVENLTCDPVYSLGVAQSVDKLYLYTESKKSKDVHKLVTLMKETSDGLYEKENPSTFYCKIKKELLQKQSKELANAIMRRY